MKNYARMGKAAGKPAFRTPALYRANKPIKTAIAKTQAERNNPVAKKKI